MIGMDILQPVVALLAWTMVMWVWMYATRIPAMNKAGIDAKNLVGGEGSSLRAHLPDTVSWKADNYNHLHEAPTLFYAVAIVLAIRATGSTPRSPGPMWPCGLRTASCRRPSTRDGPFRAVCAVEPRADGADPARRHRGVLI